MASNNPLLPVVKDIQSKLKRIRSDVQEAIGELTSIRKTVEQGVDSILEAINDNIQAQAEMLIMEKVSEAQSISAQVDAEQDHVEMEKQDLDRKLDRISERYQSRHEDLDQKAASRVRDLGSHIFAIQEDEFEDGIETRFTDHVTGTWRDMEAYSTKVDRDRSARIESELAPTHDAISGFLERRRDLLDSIDDHLLINTTSLDQPKRIQVPFWIVTVERDGEQTEEIVVPSDLESDDDSWYTARLAERDGFRETFRAVAERNAPETTRTERPTASDVADAVASHSRSRMAGLLGFHKTIRGALADDFAVEVEGGATDE